MAATLQLPGLEAPAEVLPAEPLRGECPGCGQEVLAVETGEWVDGEWVAAGELVAEPREVMPEHDCPLCAQVEAMGHERAPGCVRCHGSRRLGEPLPFRGVAVDEFGRGRVFEGIRCEGECVLPFHSCP